MKTRVDCPYCDGTAELQKQPGEITYRKEVFKVVEHFYRCEKCAEEFTTTETDTITLAQAHNQYREKYNIPFPEEIVAIKEMYQLSATKMGEVLSLGANSYSNYEKGEMPSPAIAKLIKTAEKPEIFLGYLEEAKSSFSVVTFEKTKKNVLSLIDKLKEQQFLSTNLNIYNDTNTFTGYKKTDPDKIANLITYFISKSKPEYNSRLKLNKQLFYTDFRHYKHHGRSITGLSYRAVKYGPVPAKFDNIFSYLENEQMISPNWTEAYNGNAVEVFTTTAEFDSVLFSKEELDTIESIGNQFRDISSWDIVELSHSERAWKELESERKLIGYQQYAFDLNGA